MSLAISRYQTRCRTAPEHAPALHSVVQGHCQRAARAAPPLPLGQCCAPCARLARGRSRERMRKAETEGQIKGVARGASQSQSARRFAAAPQGVSRVPRMGRNPRGTVDCRVLFPTRCAPLRESPHAGP